MFTQSDFGRIVNWIFSITILLLAIISFIDFFIPFLPNNFEKTEFLINLLIFQVGLLVVYILSELPKIDKMGKSSSSVEFEIKNTTQSLRVFANANASKYLTGEALNKEYYLFDGFNNGVYYAVNAPLQFELHNPIRNQIDIHIDRYKSISFLKAHYSYPIFNHLTTEQKITWIKGILNFFEAGCFRKTK